MTINGKRGLANSNQEQSKQRSAIVYFEFLKVGRCKVLFPHNYEKGGIPDSKWYAERDNFIKPWKQSSVWDWLLMLTLYMGVNSYSTVYPFYTM